MGRGGQGLLKAGPHTSGKGGIPTYVTSGIRASWEGTGKWVIILVLLSEEGSNNSSDQTPGLPSPCLTFCPL
jgi:hypothetical protein